MMLCCSYEPHVLLANVGNVDWRPMSNPWAVVAYVTKYAMQAPGKSKSMKEVLRQCIDGVSKYIKLGTPLMWKNLQKVYTKMLGCRDYGIFEAVHLGLGIESPSAFGCSASEHRRCMCCERSESVGQPAS